MQFYRYVNLLVFFSVALAADVWGAGYAQMAYQASPDQVLVLYNADWKGDAQGSAPGQDSRELAEYYQQLHTDIESGVKPYVLGLSCNHLLESHLNHGTILEESTDNKNGIVFQGRGKSPDDLQWVRDSAAVEITITDPLTDWNSVLIRLKSEQTGEVRTVFSQGQSSDAAGVVVAGVPTTSNWQRHYPPLAAEQGRSYRFDAAKIFPGNVQVYLEAKNSSGKRNLDLSLRYYDKQDFAFSAVGADKISDEKILDSDVLSPVRQFLEDPANALPDGTLLREHILYIVLAYGMPYAANGVFGIEHGATPAKGNHGSLASLEQRLQTLYYDWQTQYQPPLATQFITGGPDSKAGVGNHIITTAMRYPLTGVRWNPSLHPDAYSFLRRGQDTIPYFIQVAPLAERRQRMPLYQKLYAAMRVDGGTLEEAKRLVDYSRYATRYLRPEMDCSVRAALQANQLKHIADLPERLAAADKENLWGGKELKKIGFATLAVEEGQGLPFLAMPPGAAAGECGTGKPDWKLSGFYPGGMHRQVISDNGWNLKNAAIHKMLTMGVSVSACGAPAYGGGPHITNATFWDNRIVLKYLLRGKDLGESLLLTNYYTNWSTSYVGDPLLHPDLSKTEIDTLPPAAVNNQVAVSWTQGEKDFTGTFAVALEYTPDVPEVAVLRVACTDEAGQQIKGYSPLYSRQPAVSIPGFEPDRNYRCEALLADPYENRSAIMPLTFITKKITLGSKMKKGMVEFFKDIQVGELR